MPPAPLERGQTGPMLCIFVRMAVWCLQRSSERQIRSARGRCISACALMWEGYVVPSMVFIGKVSNVLLV